MRKLFILLAAFIAFSANTMAQSNKTGEKPRPAAAYAKDEKKARENLADKDEAYILIGQWQLAQLFADENAPQQNIDSAWFYISNIDARFSKIKSDIKEKANKKVELDGQKIRKLKEFVAKSLLWRAKKTATIEAYQQALLATEKAKESGIKKSRDSVRNLYAKAVNASFDTLTTIESIVAFRQKNSVFIKDYPLQNKQLDNKVFSLYFGKNGYANTNDFCEKNKENYICKDTAFANFVKIMQARNEQLYLQYLEKHPSSTIFNEIVNDSLALLAMDKAIQTGTMKDCIRLAAKYGNTSYIGVLDQKISDLFQKMPQLYPFYETNLVLDLKKMPKTAAAVYDVLGNDGRIEPFTYFEIAFKNYPDSIAYRKDKKLAQDAKYLALDDNDTHFKPSQKEKYDAYIKAAAPKWLAFVALQKMIENDVKNKSFTAAAATVRSYQSYFGNDNKLIINLLEILEDKKESDVTIENIGESINTKDKSEIVPVLSIDGRQLFFCKYDALKGGEEDIYTSSKNSKGKWEFAYAVAGLSESRKHEAPLSISADGTNLIIFEDGILSETNKTARGWSEPKPLSNKINSSAWQGAATLSPNGKVLIYESQRAEVLGFNSFVRGSDHYDNIDLFISFRDSLGEWTQGVNLGKGINTFHCERSPYLHADMKTLYFSSDGRGGLGNRDVFKTTRLDNTWLNWSPPQNIGKEINTTGDDWGYVVSSSNVLGYFSADGEIQYITPLPKKAKASEVALVKGRLTDSKGNRVTSGKVLVRDMETNTIYMECNVDPDSGSYQMALPPGGKYSLEIIQKNSMPQFDTIDTRNITQFIERKIETRKIVNFQEMKEQGIAVPLNNLFFNTNEAFIRNESYLELDNLAKLINQNTWAVEILGHTDNVGSAEGNKKLSAARAAAVKDYLVKKGCNAAQIKTIGLGATKPIADNKDEIGRAKNRRVEIKIK